MVELLGSVLAGYAQVSFWWLSFFVNRLPVWSWEPTAHPEIGSLTPGRKSDVRTRGATADREVLDVDWVERGLVAGKFE